MFFNDDTGVVSVVNDTTVEISFTVGDACDACGLKLLCAPGRQSERRLILPQSGQFSPGQRVMVEEMSNLELHLALVQFGLPMLLFIIGLLIGYLIPQSLLPKELAAFIVGLVGLAISFFPAQNLAKRITDLIPGKYLRIRVLD